MVKTIYSLPFLLFSCTLFGQSSQSSLSTTDYVYLGIVWDPYITYPNPARDAIYIKRNYAFAGTEKVILRDLMGKEMLVREWSEDEVLWLDNLSSGIYRLTIHGAKGRFNKIIEVR